jgi:hypothetical protein
MDANFAGLSEVKPLVRGCLAGLELPQDGFFKVSVGRRGVIFELISAKAIHPYHKDTVAVYLVEFDQLYESPLLARPEQNPYFPSPALLSDNGNSSGKVYGHDRRKWGGLFQEPLVSHQGIGNATPR